MTKSKLCKIKSIESNVLLHMPEMFDNFVKYLVTPNLPVTKVDGWI